MSAVTTRTFIGEHNKANKHLSTTYINTIKSPCKERGEQDKVHAAVHIPHTYVDGNV